jgi:integrase
MVHSTRPSVWIEKRRGSGVYRVRFERAGVRYPGLPCGTSKPFANRIQTTLYTRLVERDAKVYQLLDEFDAKKIPAKTLREDLLTYLTSEQIPERHKTKLGHTVGDLLDEYLAESKKNKSPRGHEVDVYALGRVAAHFGRERALSTIKTEDLRVFQRGMVGKAGRRKDEKTKPLAPTSEAIYLNAIHAAFNRAREVYEWITHDPFKGIDIPKVGSKGRFVHDDEFEKIRPLAELVVRGERSLWEILDLMRHQGLRSGAVCALDGRMIVRKTQHLHLIKPRRLGINRDAGLKNTELYAPIHPAIWPFFERMPESGLLFPKWERRDIAKHTRKICKDAGVPHLRPHDLKHTFVTNYLKGGGTLAIASAITGTSQAMLKRVYSHLEGRVPPSEMSRVNYGSSPTTPPKSKAAGPSREPAARTPRR